MNSEEEEQSEGNKELFDDDDDLVDDNVCEGKVDGEMQRFKSLHEKHTYMTHKKKQSRPSTIVPTR